MFQKGEKNSTLRARAHPRAVLRRRTCTPPAHTALTSPALLFLVAFADTCQSIQQVRSVTGRAADITVFREGRAAGYGL